MQIEVAVISRHLHDFDLLDQFFLRAPMLDEVGDGANFQAMFLGEPHQLRQSRHGAVVAHDFANDGDGPAAGEPHQIHRRLRVTRALQHAARARAQGKHMAGLHQIIRDRSRVGHDADGLGAVRGADAGGDISRGVDADLEIRFKCLAVLADHAFDAQLLQALGSRGHADESAAKLGHEIDRRGRDEFRRHDQIAFVFAVGVVHHDHHFALLQIGDDGFYGIKPLFHTAGVS